MSLREEIVRALDFPKELERIYRKDPTHFTGAFREVFAEFPDSAVLQVWHARLFFKSSPDTEFNQDTCTWKLRDIMLVVALSLIAGTLIKIPDFAGSLDSRFFYSRYPAFIVFMALAAYFLIQNAPSFKTAATISALFVGSLIYTSLLPDDSKSQTTVLSCLHMPFFLWSLLGIAFVSGRYKDFTGRMDYIRYNGEALIFTTVILIGGMVLTGVTLALFKLIDLSIEEWYVRSIAVYGSVASPIVGTFLVDKITGTRLKIAPILAKTFTPLFFLTTLAYLGAMISQGKSPYTNRDFLIAFNILLLIVLGLSVFTVSERGSKQDKAVGDFMNIALVAVTLAIDLIALSAIFFRLSSYGFTPNRIAVLGANLLVFCHLCGIVFQYVQFLRGAHAFSSLEDWIAGYLPVYTLWTVIVAFGFPLFFIFK